MCAGLRMFPTCFTCLISELCDDFVGTGKSLSLICGALTWLRDHEQREEQKLQKPSANSLVVSVVTNRISGGTCLFMLLRESRVSLLV